MPLPPHCSEKDDRSSDSGHQNPSIVFDHSLLSSSLLYTADEPDSPWMEPTAKGWDAKKAALVSAIQGHLKAAYSARGHVPALDKVAETILRQVDEEVLKAICGANNRAQ
jgi:hypothetical protein